MWAMTMAAFPRTAPVNPVPSIGTSRPKPTNLSLLKLRVRASFSDYPLASRIMVRNLPYNLTESGLRDEFSKFGPVAEVDLVKDEGTKKFKGYAFVQYTSQDDAMLALESMDTKQFDGRVIFVEIAKPVKGFRGHPIASGPPPKQYMQQQEEVADCWY